MYDSPATCSNSIYILSEEIWLPTSLWLFQAPSQILSNLNGTLKQNTPKNQYCIYELCIYIQNNTKQSKIKLRCIRDGDFFLTISNNFLFISTTNILFKADTGGYNTHIHMYMRYKQKFLNRHSKS